jgi:hypothetical protein
VGCDRVQRYCLNDTDSENAPGKLPATFLQVEVKVERRPPLGIFNLPIR